MSWLRKLWFNLSYLGSPPWDTGVTPPEVEEYIATHPPGKALDLGCGSGTNVLRLARAGWEVAGVDFAGRAIAAARKRARREGVRAEFIRADVTRLQGLQGPYDLILDIGCFHALPRDRRQDYARMVSDRLSPGGSYLLYAFLAPEGGSGPGTTETELSELFSSLVITRRETGEDRGERTSIWSWYQKPDESH